MVRVVLNHSYHGPMKDDILVNHQQLSRETKPNKIVLTEFQKLQQADNFSQKLYVNKK